MTDALLTRLTATSAHRELSPIPWPEGLAPTLIAYSAAPTDPLPKADVVVLTYTAAEHQAMTDVLTPGATPIPYAHDFSDYAPMLTWRSPAREAKRLGEYALTRIGDKTVLCFHSQLHLATDSAAIPLRTLWRQIIAEAKPSAVIDTGTAGGIGAQIVEGDCIVGQNIRFDCTSFLRSEPYAHANYPCTFDTSTIDFTIAEQMMAANAGLLKPQASRDPVVVRGDVLTCDAFLFDDAEDTYGLRTYDPAARCEEMDAAVLGLVAEDLGSAMPAYTSIRSASDPQIPDLGSIAAEKADAARIYASFGYAAQVATLCDVWQVVTSL